MEVGRCKIGIVRMSEKSPPNYLLMTNLTHFFISFLSTCYERHSAIIRRSDCINTSSGMFSLCAWYAGIPSSHSHRLIIPDDVLIQFNLLMMSTVMLETCREV